MHCTVLSGCPCLNGRTVEMVLGTTASVPHGPGLCGDPRHPFPNPGDYPFSFPTNELAYFSTGASLQTNIPSIECMYPLLPPELGGFAPLLPMRDLIVNDFDIDEFGRSRRGTPFPMAGFLHPIVQCCNFDFFNGNNPGLPPSPDMIGYVGFGFTFLFALGLTPTLGPPPGWQGWFQMAHAGGSRSDRQFESFSCNPFELVVKVPLDNATFISIHGADPGYTLPNSWRRSINLCPDGEVTLVFTE